MARGPNINRQELRGSIVAVATEIIRSEGAASLSVRKIAGEIGCALGTIYNVFKNLDDILLSINRTTMASFQKELEARASREDDSFQAVIAMGRAYVAFSQEQYHLWSLMVDHKLAPGNTLPPGYAERVADLFLLVSELLLPLVQGDRERADRAAKVLWASLHGVCSLAMSGKLSTVNAETAEILAESLLYNYLRGLQLEGKDRRA